MDGICQQRRRQQLFPVPPFRLQADPSPYIGNDFNTTKTQLDMRRKAEILKYLPNKSSNQTNNLTKSQRWAQIVSGNYNITPNNQGNQSIGQIPSVTNEQCPLDNLIPTPTSSSNIPGPIINLINDETVQLYNYINPILTRTYSELDMSQTIEPSKYLYSDVQFSPGIPSTIASIYYRYLPNPFQYSYNINNIPIGIVFSADIDSTSSYRSNPITFSISISAFDLYYNDTINPTSTKIYTSTTNVGNIIFDVSGRTGGCSLSKYIGYVSVSNFKISANQGNIYDIKPTFAVTITGITGQFLNYSYKIIGNISSENTNVANKCNIISVASVPFPYPQFTFV